MLGFGLGLAICLVTDIESFVLNESGIRFDTRELNDVELLESAWESDARRQTVLGFLAAKGVFKADDIRLAPAIEGLCEELPLEPLEAHLSAALKCAEIPTVKALRELADRRRPPFHPYGKLVRIGVPRPKDQPSRGRANACRAGEWFGRQVLLTNPATRRQAEVDASGHYGAGVCGGTLGTADFQLNEADALAIFDGPLGKFEEAVAIIID